mgnify:CR=1 FL=1
MNSIKFTVLLEIMCQIYAKLIRDILWDAMNDPDKEWDDFLMASMDRIFKYEE